jgi:hypothetical protein
MHTTELQIKLGVQTTLCLGGAAGAVEALWDPAPRHRGYPSHCMGSAKPTPSDYPHVRGGG